MFIATTRKKSREFVRRYWDIPPPWEFQNKQKVADNAHKALEAVSLLGVFPEKLCNLVHFKINFS